MKFEDKLIELRRKKGWSQEQLADYMDVSRQAVGKWEAGNAMPDIPKLVTLADLFGVTVDELVRNGPAATPGNAPVAMGPLVPAAYLGYEYKSKKKLFGLPLVHINTGRFTGRVRVAKGIIAVGDVALGGIAIGGVTVGGLSFGGVSVGLLLGFGGIAVGGFALGGLAVGIFALGGLAVGLCSIGGAAIASEAAAGGYANAKVAVGNAVEGMYTMTRDTKPDTLNAFLQLAKQTGSKAPEWFLKLIYQFY